MSLDKEFIESLVRGDHIRYSIRQDNPNISDEDFEILEKFSPKDAVEEEPEIDPRWEALKKLKD